VSLSAIGATTFLALKNQSADMVMRERARLLDLTHDTVFVRDMNDVITYWNRGAEELYGWQRDEAIGQVSHQLEDRFSCAAGKDHGRAVPHRPLGRRTRPREAGRHSCDRGEQVVLAAG
jgi:PAS domain S-box-containing protein